MHSTSVYSLKLSVLEGAGAKALATDHRDNHKEVRIHILQSQGYRCFYLKGLYCRLNQQFPSFFLAIFN